MGMLAYAQVPASAWDGAETVYLPYEGFDEVLTAIETTIPDTSSLTFNHDGKRAWVTVSKPALTRDVVAKACRSLGRDWPQPPEGPGEPAA